MAKLPNIQSKKRSVFFLFRWILVQVWQESKGVFLGSVFLTLLSVGISFANSVSFAQILNILSAPNATFAKVLPYLVMILLFDYLPGVFQYAQASLDEFLDRKLRIRFEQQLIAKAGSIDIATIEQPEFQDILFQVQSRGIPAMQTIFSWVFILLRQISRMVVGLAIIFSLSKIALLVMVVATVPTYFYESWRGRRLAVLWANKSENNRKAGMKMSLFSSKIALLELKFFNITDYFAQKIKDIRLEHHHEYTRDDKQTLPMYIISSLLPNIGIATSVVIVIGQVLRGLRPIGTLSLLWSSVFQFSGGFQTILRSVGRLDEHSVHANKLIDLLTTDPFVDPNEKNGKIYPLEVAPTIEFKNVSFVYPGTDKKVLEGLTCIFGAGKEIALVGLNGAGKTTLLRLLTRVYDPTDGEILVNGIPLKEYRLSSWRNAMSVMLQDYIVYSDETIQDNIVLRDQKIDQRRLEQVVTETGVADYVQDFKEGLHQMVGREFQGGVELSKGQNQKLVIARALYKNAPCIILDEPTAAIDAVSDDKIFKSIRENHATRTRVLISHKFSNVRDADHIVLIEHGKSIEQGNHETLMKKRKGKYKELFNLQAEGYR